MKIGILTESEIQWLANQLLNTFAITGMRNKGGRYTRVEEEILKLRTEKWLSESLKQIYDWRPL